LFGNPGLFAVIIEVSPSRMQAANSIANVLNVWIVIKAAAWGNNKTRHKRRAKG
jgi:hypothetical protein